jgi:hypothetical protein
LYRLVDQLPESTYTAAEAFLAFLRERAGSQPHSPGYFDEQRWATTRRRGLENRRHQREVPATDPGSSDDEA